MAEDLMPAPPEAGASTEERLLAAAEKLFAEHGFAAASVRDITAEAGTSVAAVNYHFGGKDSLYRELFLRRLRGMREQRLQAIERVVAEAEETGRPIDPARLLKSFAVSFLEPVADPERGRSLVKLMTRELIDPCLPPAVFCEEMVQPVEAAFVAALRRAVPALGERDAVLAVHCFVAQLMYVVDIASLVGTLDGHHTLGGSLASLTDDIVRFSTAGLTAFAPGMNA